MQERQLKTEMLMLHSKHENLIYWIQLRSYLGIGQLNVKLEVEFNSLFVRILSLPLNTPEHPGTSRHFGIF